MKADLTKQKIWSDIATAYEKAIVRTTFYHEMMVDLKVQLKGRKNILDMGCGVGYLINELMKEDGSRTIVGIDANQYMLDIAGDVVIEERFRRNVRLHQADAATFRGNEGFDAVVSSNLLFNLKDPYTFLDNVFENLKPGGIFVLTSAKNNPSLGLAIGRMKEEFKRDGRYDELIKHVDVVESVNGSFMGDMKTFDNHEIERVLIDFIGFEKVIANHDSYLGQNFVIAVKKPQYEANIIYKIPNEEEKEKMYRLRYHLLHDRYGFIPANDERREKIIHDDHATHFIAMDSRTERVVGCLFYLEYEKGVGFPAEKEFDMEHYLSTHEKLSTPGRWYVLPAYRQMGVGRKLFEEYFKTCLERKVTGTIFSINPENEKFFERLGARKLGKAGKNYVEFNKPAPTLPVYIDLRAGMPKYFDRKPESKSEKRQSGRVTPVENNG